MLRSLWEFRSLVAGLALRDFRVQTLRTLWGQAWIFIQPLFQIFIYVVIFAEVLGAKLPGERDPLAYGLYVCVGLLAWNFFSELLLDGRTVFLDHADLLRTARIPRSALPLALALRAGIRAALPFGAFVILLSWMGRLSWGLVPQALPFVAVFAMLAFSLAVLFGTLNVFIRDVGQMVPVLLQLWFWLTPIVYPIEIVPEAARAWLAWNPIAPLIGAAQAVFVFDRPPDFGLLPALAFLGVASCALSWAVFRGLSDDLVDEI